MRKKYLVILSLFIAMILCFTAPAVALADTVVVNPGGGNVTVIVPTNPGGGSSTIVTVTEDKPVIGDTVSFAEHEWYVIGTDSEGLIAPEGCYTLFAKNNDFGSSAFRAGDAGYLSNPTAANYKDSDLQTAMENIANNISSAEIANIVPRATLDDIKGDAVTDQLFWPIGNDEMWNIYDSVKQFDAVYWGRSGFFGSGASDVFIPPEDSTRSLSTLSSSTRSTRPESADPNKFSVYAYNQDGSERWEATSGVLGVWASTPNYVFAVRPAAYVKTDAVSKTESKEYKAVIGSQIQFAGYHWYIVGMGDTGPVPGPANTVTLFAASSIKDETGECINSYTDTNYADGELSTVMKGLSDTLGLSAREKALITDRTLTTADGISGNSVTTPFWPLSIDEYEAIYEYDPSFLTDTPGWYYWLRTEYGAYSCIYSVNTKNGSTTTIYGNTNSFWVRPACYLDLSDLFFASGDSGMGASVGALPSKLEAPLYGSLQNYNFVMHDDTLSLSMIGAAKQRGSSLTFHYDAVQGEKHYLSYLVERASAPGIPVYYGQAVNLSNSGSGTVTVPLTSDGNMRTGIPLVNGEYILRFYTEDVSQGSVIFAGDTVDLDIRVEDNLVYINDLKDVSPATMVGSMWIDPGQADVEAGKQFQFSAFISPFTETGWFDPVLIWDVTGANSYGTSISQDGLLTVALNETSTELRVTVTSRQDYEMQCVSLVTVTPHVHVGTLVAGTPVTCTESGTKDYYTCVCGKCFEDADCTTEITDLDTWKILSPLGHDFVWTYNGDGTHTGVCQRDGCEETVTDNCSGGEATFFHPAICEVCGGEYIAQKIYKATIDFDGQTYYYETFGEAVDALGEFSTTAEKRAVLKLFDNIDLTSALTFNTGFITLDLNGYMLKQTGSGSVISINEGADVVLDDLSGATATHNYYVAEDGLWVFYDGDLPAEAAGAETGVVTGGVITGGNATNGGGVSVYGTFTMNDGTIAGNRSTGGSMNYGGGVYVRGTVTMNGGVISGNTAGVHGGGVSVYGTFTMTGGYLDGTIHGNTVSISGGYFAEEFDTAYLAENCVLQDVSALGGATFDGDYKDGFPYAVYAQGGILISTNKDIVYDSSPVAEGVDFTVEGTDGVTLTYSYKVESDDEFTAGLPTNAGDYTVYVYALNGEKQFISMVFDITIAKATYDMSGITFADDRVTYDGEVHSLEISGDLPAGVSVTYAGNDKTNAGEYTVTATFAGDSANYNAIPDMTAMLTIDKAMPVYTTPENLTICVEHTLADVTLPAGWTWEDGTLSVGETGEKQFKAIFTPEDTSNYNTVEESVTVTVVAHTGGTATCTQKAVCSVCGMEYGELAPHVYDQRVTAEENLASAATCTAKATYYYSCVCGEKGTETFEYGELAPHVYDKEVATAEYLASKATCTAKATYYYSCVCGEKGTETFEYGELAEHTAAEIPAVEATCTQSGMTAGSKCSVCGEILVEPEEIAPLGHVDENGDERCDRCGFDMRIPEFTITVSGGTIEGATGSTVIVEEKGSVTVVAGETPEGKEFKGWSIDGGETIVSEEAAYTFTASEDMTLTAVYEDKAAAVTPETPEGLSGGAIAGIVIGSVLGALIIAYGVCALLYKKKLVKGAFFAKIYPFIKD